MTYQLKLISEPCPNVAFALLYGYIHIFYLMSRWANLAYLLGLERKCKGGYA